MRYIGASMILGVFSLIFASLVVENGWKGAIIICILTVIATAWVVLACSLMAGVSL